jgi:hypothetical protein
MTISTEALEMAAKVEAFVREKIFPYEQGPRRDHHGAPTDELVMEMRELAREAGVLTPHIRPDGSHFNQRETAVILIKSGITPLGMLACNTQAPDAPLKKTERWAMLGMKRMIQWAAENGFDKVAWLPGEQQADRYDLSKQISRVVFEDNYTTGVGRVDMTAPMTGGSLKAYDLNGKLVIDKRVNPDQLSDYIGKEAAQKLIEQTRLRNDLRG